jgi:hypothetical protein
MDSQTVLKSLPILNEDMGIEDMNMGYETESISGRDFSSDDTTDEKSCDEQEAEHHRNGTTHESAFETHIVPEETQARDDIPIINASKFRKAAYE